MLLTWNLIAVMYSRKFWEELVSNLQSFRRCHGRNRVLHSVTKRGVMGHRGCIKMQFLIIETSSAAKVPQSQNKYKPNWSINTDVMNMSINDIKAH